MQRLSWYIKTLLAVLCLSTLLVGCKGNDDDLTQTQDETVGTIYEITYVYIPNGMGDNSYTDILFAFNTLIGDLLLEYLPKEQTKDSIYVRHMIPLTLDQSYLIIKDWDNQKASENTRRLLVLTSSIFMEGLQDCTNWRHDKNSKVLMLDAMPVEDESLYTIGMSLYGPAWEAGYLLRSSGKYDSQSIAIIVANSVDRNLTEAVKGWNDGYAAALQENETMPEIPIYEVGKYSDEARAMQMTDTLILRDGVRHLVCFTGAAQKGVLRSIDAIRIAQEDLDCDIMATICEGNYLSYWKPSIACQLVKEMRYALLFWLSAWLDDKVDTLDRNTVLTMDSVNTQIAPLNYLNLQPISLKPESDEQMSWIREKARDAEKDYFGL